MVDKKLLEHRKEAKANQPRFLRQEFHKRKRLAESWRKPRGIHSKLRLRRRGKGKMVSVGYKMPDEVRGLSKEGAKCVLVSKPTHLKYVKSGEVAILRKMSNKSRLAILTEAKKLNVNVLNFRDITKKISEITESLSSKKIARKLKETKRAEKEAEVKRKSKMTEKQAAKEEKQKEVTTEKKSDTPKETPKAESAKKEAVKPVAKSAETPKKKVAAKKEAPAKKKAPEAPVKEESKSTESKEAKK
ncbi:hypothetical protein HOD83_00935 [Candidatus Woesearchaeota archaeon]|jgi:large subunit ribosomal protein L32e|nr:hypothetical protein [Candidatus Woesearchaeota archaeon]MBT4114765.1 hypothetical protein [Candidatus Woesearchaeota archaeon]MBT4248138.1 hypothetical protein [Candidatus Woesearchaeota archaeon]